MRDNKGRFTDNNTGKPKGAISKVSRTLKERLSAAIEEDFDMIIQEVRTLEGKEKVQAYIKLMEFVLPKQKYIEQTETRQVNIPIEAWLDLDKWKAGRE